MKNNRGSVLIITLGFILTFTLLGMASIHLAGVQNELAEKRTFSTKAFWLADGAIQRAKSQLPGVLLNATAVSLPNTIGTYDITVVTQGTDRWLATATGTVHNQFRTIVAEIANYDILDAITTKGTINGGCEPTGNAEIDGTCVQGAQFSFESVFNGLTKQDIKSLASALYDNYDLNNIPNNNTINAVTGITFVTFNGNEKESIHVPSNSSGSGFLIIDASEATNTVSFDVTGGSFYGIIWVIGNNVSMTGNPDIQGALFIDGTQDSKLSGTASVVFDEEAIAQAITDIGPTLTNKKPAIVSWKEI